MTVERVTLAEVQTAAYEVACRWRGDGIDSVFGVPRGGLLPAALVAGELGVPLVEEPSPRTLIVDDLVDSGATLSRFNGSAVDALFRKPHSPNIAPSATVRGGWLVFPWEGDSSGPEDAVVRLLEFVGEDPNRGGLVDTPGRVVRAYAEMTEGYQVEIASLFRTFEDACDEMVVVRDVNFTSLCEHHLLPFVGSATVGYVPVDRVVGLSKLARVVDAFARRLQVQERLTKQIADAIEHHLAPAGVGVVVRAHHSCMGCRGVRKQDAEMVTSALLGVFRDIPAARAEFLHLAHS